MDVHIEWSSAIEGSTTSEPTSETLIWVGEVEQLSLIAVGASGVCGVVGSRHINSTMVRLHGNVVSTSCESRISFLEVVEGDVVHVDSTIDLLNGANNVYVV